MAEGQAEDIMWIGGAELPIPLKVREIVVPILDDAALTLVGVEVSQEGHRQILWVFIDHSDGVNIDHCAQVSPEISAALDVDEPLTDAYELRVSSPGLDRPIMNSHDFAAFAGREVLIQLAAPLLGRRKFTGDIIGCEAGEVELACADGTHKVPLGLIQRARLRYVAPQKQKKTKTGQRRR